MKYTLTKIYVFIALFCLLNQAAYCQNEAIDSINIRLENHDLQDTTRANLLIEMARAYQHVSIDSVFAYASIAENLAKKLNFEIGEANSLLLLVDYYKFQHQLENAQMLNLKALSIFKKHEDKKGILNSHNNLGDIAYAQFQYDTALFYYNKMVEVYFANNEKKPHIHALGVIAEIYRMQEEFVKAREAFKEILALAKEVEFNWAEMMALYSLGKVSYALSDFSEAIDYYNQALIIAREFKDNRMIPVLIHNIGVIYMDLESYEKSQEYIKKAFVLYKENKDYENTLNCLNDLGSLYKGKKEYATALTYYQRALEIAKEQRNANIKATIFNNIGHLYIFLERYDESIDYLNKGLKESAATKSKERMVYSHLGFGKVYFRTKQYNLALSNALKSLQLIKELNLVSHRNEIHELLADIYAETGQFQKAYEHQILFKNFTDSAFNSEKTKKIAQLEVEYKYREEKLLAKLTEENLILENRKTKESLILIKNQKLWMIIGILILALILVFVIMNHNVRSLHLKTKNALTEQKLLRSQMTPHFMFNSLSVLQGIILNKEYNKSINYLSKFSSLLRLSLENSRTTLVALEKEVKAIEKYLIVQNIARQLPFRYQILIEEVIEQNELMIPPMLIQPFVENAIKHGFRELKEDQLVDIHFSLSDECLTCKITDNGVGIDFHQNTFSNANTSISTDLIRERLEILSKEYRLKLGVDIRDRSGVNETGTIVTINLPYKIQIEHESTTIRG